MEGIYRSVGASIVPPEYILQDEAIKEGRRSVILSGSCYTTLQDLNLGSIRRGLNMDEATGFHHKSTHIPKASSLEPLSPS